MVEPSDGGHTACGIVREDTRGSEHGNTRGWVQSDVSGREHVNTGTEAHVQVSAGCFSASELVDAQGDAQ